MSRPLLLGFGLLMLATLAFICLRLNGPRIESDIQMRSQQTASASGLSGVTTETSGRDVTLSGTVSSNADRNMIERNVARLDGVRTVNNLIEVVAPVDHVSTGPRLQIDYDGQYLALTGQVANKSMHDALLEAAANVVGKPKLAQDLTYLAEKGTAKADTIVSLLPELRSLEFAQVVVADKKVTLQGYASSPQVKSALEIRASALMQDHYDIAFMIEAPEVDDAPSNSPVVEQPDTTSARELSESTPPVITETAVAPEKVRQQAASCQQQFDTLMQANRIIFGTNSNAISSESDGLIRQVATLARSCPDVRIEIGGHTDTRGDARSNQLLSQRRAEAVKDALVSHGAAASRLVTIGYGESEPIANESTPEGLQKNRRIEFTIKE